MRSGENLPIPLIDALGEFKFDDASLSHGIGLTRDLKQSGAWGAGGKVRVEEVPGVVHDNVHWLQRFA